MNVFLSITLIITIIISAFVLYRFRHDLQIGLTAAVILAVVHTMAGVFCVRTFAGLESLSSPLNAGMSLFGALFFLPLFYWLGGKLTHRDIALIFDDFCLCVIVALMCVRCSCIVNGCCMGKVIAGTDMRWPTRQIEIAFWAGMLIWFLMKKKRGYVKGSLYPLMLMVYGIFRFFIEFFRDEDAVLFGFHFGHIWAAVAFVAGSSIYFFLAEASYQKKQRGKLRRSR